MSLYSSLLLGTLTVGGAVATGIGIWFGNENNSKESETSNLMNRKTKNLNHDKVVNLYINQNQEKEKQQCDQRKLYWIVWEEGKGTCSSNKPNSWPKGIVPPPLPLDSFEKNEDHQDGSTKNLYN